MLEGPEAVDSMIGQYPSAGSFFSAGHLQPEMFARVMDQWLVFEEGGCWVGIEGSGPRRTLHWFCPHGASLPALRAILYRLFTKHGIEAVEGTQPPDSDFKREARTLARALGAEREGDRQVLTSARFMAYNVGKRGFGTGDE